MEVRLDDLSGREIAALIDAHLEHCRKWSPPESVHARDLDALRAKDITFWSVWQGECLVGCGALKELDPLHGEIKSMHTAAQHRGKGAAATILAHITEVARTRGYRRLSLETGSHEAFAPARALYSRFGFVTTGPFGDYLPDPHSVFMQLDLAPPAR